MFPHGNTEFGRGVAFQSSQVYPYGRDGENVEETLPRTRQQLAMANSLSNLSRALSRPPAWGELHDPELDNPPPGYWNPS